MGGIKGKEKRERERERERERDKKRRKRKKEGLPSSSRIATRMPSATLYATQKLASPLTACASPVSTVY